MSGRVLKGVVGVQENVVLFTPLLLRIRTNTFSTPARPNIPAILSKV